MCAVKAMLPFPIRFTIGQPSNVYLAESREIARGETTLKISRYATWVATILMAAAILTGCTGVTVTINRATPIAIDAATPEPTAVPAASSSASFSTPEAAITAYLDGVKQQDVNAIFAASAIDAVAQDFDFQAYADRLQAMPLVTSPAPAEYPFYAEMNRVRRQNEVLSQVRNFAYSLLSTEAIDGSITANPGAERVQAFVAKVDPSRLAGIELIQVGAPSPDLLSSTRYQENAAKQAAIYGADELTERVALLSFEGKDYLLGFTLVRYGDGWKVMNQTSNLAGTSALGTVAPTTPGEFAALIASN